MTAKCRDITGQRFGRLTAVRFLWLKENKGGVWLLKCDCGEPAIASVGYLSGGNTKSCGCLRDDARRKSTKVRGYALHNSREYQTWCGIKQRCHCPTYRLFKDYGGRGITVCDRWRDSFENFLADMGPRPEGYSIERADVNGNYEPSNCKWIPRADQNKNTRTTKRVVLHGEVVHQAEAARRLGVHPQTVAHWLAGRRACSRPDGLATATTP